MDMDMDMDMDTDMDTDTDTDTDTDMDRDMDRDTNKKIKHFIASKLTVDVNQNNHFKTKSFDVCMITLPLRRLKSKRKLVDSSLQI